MGIFFQFFPGGAAWLTKKLLDTPSSKFLLISITQLGLFSSGERSFLFFYNATKLVFFARRSRCCVGYGEC